MLLLIILNIRVFSAIQASPDCGNLKYKVRFQSLFLVFAHTKEMHKYLWLSFSISQARKSTCRDASYAHILLLVVLVFLLCQVGCPLVVPVTGNLWLSLGVTGFHWLSLVTNNCHWLPFVFTDCQHDKLKNLTSASPRDCSSTSGSFSLTKSAAPQFGTR